MGIKEHTIYSGIGALVLCPFIGWNAILVFLSGILIDVDHYIFYVERKRKLHPIEGYKYMRRVHQAIVDDQDRFEHFYDINYFHTIEFVLALGLGSIFYRPFLYILTGVLFHLAIDLIFLAKNNLLGIRAFSFVEFFLKKEKNRQKIINVRNID